MLVYHLVFAIIIKTILKAKQKGVLHKVSWFLLLVNEADIGCTMGDSEVTPSKPREMWFTGLLIILCAMYKLNNNYIHLNCRSVSTSEI